MFANFIFNYLIITKFSKGVVSMFNFRISVLVNWAIVSTVCTVSAPLADVFRDVFQVNTF